MASAEVYERLTFPSAKHADLAKQTLEVDDELQPDKIQKTFQVQDTVLQVMFQATEIRLLRAAVSSFYDMALVISKTFQEFDTILYLFNNMRRSAGQAIFDLEKCSFGSLMLALSELQQSKNTVVRNDTKTFVHSLTFITETIRELHAKQQKQPLEQFLSSILQPIWSDLASLKRRAIDKDKSFAVLHWMVHENPVALIESFAYQLKSDALTRTDQMGLIYGIYILVKQWIKDLPTQIDPWLCWSTLATILLEYTTTAHSKPTRIARIAADAFVLLTHLVARHQPVQESFFLDTCFKVLGQMKRWYINSQHRILFVAALTDLEYYSAVAIKCRKQYETQVEDHKTRIEIAERHGRSLTCEAPVCEKVAESAVAMFCYQWTESSAFLVSKSKIDTHENAIRMLQMLLTSSSNDASSSHAAIRNICFTLGRFKVRDLEILFEKEKQLTQQLLQHGMRLLAVPCTENSPMDMATHLAASLVRETWSGPSIKLSQARKAHILTLLLRLIESNDGLSKAAVLITAEIVLQTKCGLSELNNLLGDKNETVVNNVIRIIQEIVLKGGLEWRRRFARPVVGLLKHTSLSVRQNAIKVVDQLDITIVVEELCQFIVDAKKTADPYTKTVAGDALQRLMVAQPESLVIFLDQLRHGPSNFPDEQRHSVSPSQMIDDNIKAGLNDNELLEWQSAILDCVGVWISKLPHDTTFDLSRQIIQKAFASPEDNCMFRCLRLVCHTLGRELDAVITIVLKYMKNQSTLTMEMLTSNHFHQKTAVQQLVFVRLCPLLILKAIPAHYFPKPTDGEIINELYLLLLEQMFQQLEFKEVRTVAAEILAKFPSETILPAAAVYVSDFLVYLTEESEWSFRSTASTLWEFDASIKTVPEQQDITHVKLWIFALCRHVVQRPLLPLKALLGVLITILPVLCLPCSSDHTELDKLQLGCIDCLAFMIENTLSTSTARVPEPRIQEIDENVQQVRQSDLLDVILDLIIHHEVQDTTIATFPAKQVEWKSALSVRLTGIVLSSVQICLVNAMMRACERIRKPAYVGVLLDRSLNSGLLHATCAASDSRVKRAFTKILFSAVFHEGLEHLPVDQKSAVVEIAQVSYRLLNEEDPEVRLTSLQLFGAIISKTRYECDMQQLQRLMHIDTNAAVRQLAASILQINESSAQE